MICLSSKTIFSTIKLILEFLFVYLEGSKQCCMVADYKYDIRLS